MRRTQGCVVNGNSPWGHRWCVGLGGEGGGGREGERGRCLGVVCVGGGRGGGLRLTSALVTRVKFGCVLKQEIKAPRT